MITPRRRLIAFALLGMISGAISATGIVAFAPPGDVALLLIFFLPDRWVHAGLRWLAGVKASSRMDRFRDAWAFCRRAMYHGTNLALRGCFAHH